MRWITHLAAGVTALALAGASQAQPSGFDGDWEGVLQAGAQKLRLELHVETVDGQPTGLLNSLDQGVKIPASVGKIENGELGLLFMAAGGELKGRLSPDGQTMNATWAQQGTLPLTLTRKAKP